MHVDDCSAGNSMAPQQKASIKHQPAAFRCILGHLVSGVLMLLCNSDNKEDQNVELLSRVGCPTMNLRSRLNLPIFFY